MILRNLFSAFNILLLLSLKVSAEVQVQSGHFNPNVTAEQVVEIQNFYRDLDTLDKLTNLSALELKHLATESIRIGQIQEKLFRVPKAFGCLSQKNKILTDTVKIDCLTNAEYSMLSEYKDDEEFRNINDALRFNDALPPNRRISAMFEELRNLITALAKLTPVEQITFRGSTNIARFANLKKGETFIDKAFLSSRLSASVAMRFSKGEVLMILRSKTCPYVTGAEDGTLRFTGELEVLCQPSTRFTVVETMKINEQLVLFLDEQ